MFCSNTKSCPNTCFDITFETQSQEIVVVKMLILTFMALFTHQVVKYVVAAKQHKTEIRPRTEEAVLSCTGSPTV